MKREFLQSLLVAGAPLTKEVIDAIMAENGRDIESAKGDTAQLQALLAEKETWENSLRAEKENWEATLRAQQEKHEKALGEMQFSHTLDCAIREARGRNAKAISALLDLETLRGNPEAIGGAVDRLREEAPYLFESQVRPPLFAQGTGAQTGLREEGPSTLAGALKERMNYERK